MEDILLKLKITSKNSEDLSSYLKTFKLNIHHKLGGML
jgi:hypothetical protein